MIKEYPLSEYLNKFIELDNEHKNHTNIAFLSSFTINGLSETVQVKCNEKKIYCDTYAGAYNQFSQEILNLKTFYIYNISNMDHNNLFFRIVIRLHYP